MSTRSPGKVTARVVMMPCSLPKVTNEPVSETPPMSTVNATTPSVHGLSPCAISTSATSAAAPPPTPLKAATSCGICVICTRRAAMTAITEPTAIARDDPAEVAQLDAQQVREHRERRPGRAEQVRATGGARVAEALEREDEQHRGEDVADRDDLGWQELHAPTSAWCQRSGSQRREVLPPTRTTPPMSASACEPTTLPGPARSWPGPDSVFSTSATAKLSPPVRSRGPVIA